MGVSYHLDDGPPYGLSEVYCHPENGRAQFQIILASGAVPTREAFADGGGEGAPPNSPWKKRLRLILTERLSDWAKYNAPGGTDPVY